MATLTAKWIYTANQTVTITVATLADQNLAISTAIDNTINGYMSLDLQIQIMSGAFVFSGGLYETPAVGIYLIRTVDGSTSGNFDNVFGPGQSNINNSNVNNPELLTIIYTPVAATTYRGSARIENLPSIFKFLIYNGTGWFLNGTPSNHYIKYASKHLQVV